MLAAVYAACLDRDAIDDGADDPTRHADRTGSDAKQCNAMQGVE